MSKRVSKPEPAAVPTLTSDRMALLGPLVTPRALEIARHRLITHADRVNKLGDDTGTKRVALLLVRFISPDAFLTNEEEGILRGIDADVFGTKRRAREI